MSSDKEPDKSDLETHGWESGASGHPGSGSNDHGLKIRCPHCRNPIEVVADDALQEQTCPSCGSHFSLIQGESHTTAALQTVRKLGQFELIEQLGVGAFGSVWKARDTELDRTVAIKIPRRDQLGPDEIEQFFREARAAAQLRHPNIVSVHEVGRDGNTVYIVSDLIRGVTLTDWLTAQQPTPKEAAKICEKIAVALDHAHQRGVIHRDLKPGNVMLDGDGQPHIMDFGLAKREAGEITMTVEGRILGTPAYMSPEQARGEGHTADRRTDLYSLGVILFELLTSELPFRGTPRMLLHQVLNEEPRTPRTLNDRVPRDLETICLKAMAKEPSRRYETTQAFADDLARWQKGEPIHARPVSSFERTWRWCKRNPTVASLSTAVALLLLFATLLSSASAIRLKMLGDRERVAKQKAEALAESERTARQDVEVRELRARRFLYLVEMKSAQEAWERYDISRVVRLLDGLRPQPGQADVRTWDWHHLWNLTHTASFTHRMAEIQQIEFSRDGTMLAVAGKASTAWFRERSEVKLRSNGDMTTDSKPDVRKGVSEVRILDATSGAVKTTIFNDMETVERLAFSANGTELAIMDVLRLVIADTKTGKTKEIIPRKPDVETKCLALSPDFTTLVVGYNQSRVALWDIEENRERIELNKLLKHSKISTTIPDWDMSPSGRWTNVKPTAAAEFSPNGQTLAIFSEDRSVITLWDVAARKVRATLPKFDVPVWPGAITFSPDGSILATVSLPSLSDWQLHKKTEAKLWDVSTGKFRFSPGSWFIDPNLSFSPDGKRLAVDAENTEIWDVESGKKLTELDTAHKKKVKRQSWGASDIEIVGNGETLAALSENTIGLWDIADLNADLGNGGDKRDDELRLLEGHSNLPTWHFSTQIGDFQLEGSPTGNRFASSGPSFMQDDPQFEARFPGPEQVFPMEVKVWDLAQLKKPLAFSPGQTRLSHTGERMTRRGDHVTYTRHHSPGEVKELLISRDNSFFVTREPKNVTILDRATGAERAKLIDPYPTNFLNGIPVVAYSPDGKTIITGSDVTTAGYGKSAKIWDTATGIQQATLVGHESWVYGVAFSPDGKTILTVSDDTTARLWDSTSLKLRAILRPSKSWIHAAAFSPDSSTLVTGSIDGAAKLWNVADGHERANLPGHKNSVVRVSFASNGKTIATGDQPLDYNEAKTIKLWTVADATEIVSFSVSHMSELIFSPDGSSAALFGSSDDLVIYDTRTGRELKRVRAHEDWIKNAVYSPDGATIATSSTSSSRNEVKIWDAATLKLRKTLAAAASVQGVTFSPDGKTIAAHFYSQSATEPIVQVWNTADCLERFRINNPDKMPSRIMFSPDSQWFVINGHPPAIYSTSNGEILPKLENLKQRDIDSFSPDGKSFITSDRYTGASVWDATTHKEHAILVHQFNRGFEVNAVAISSDDRYVVTATNDTDRSVVIWDAVEGRERTTLHGKARVVEKVAISPDDRILATLGTEISDHSNWRLSGRTVDLWDLSIGNKSALEIDRKAPLQAACIAFSPNGKWFFIGRSVSPSLLFEPSSGKLIRLLELNNNAVRAVAFSPDSQILAESAGDRTVRLWDTNTWTERGAFKTQKEVKYLAFTPDGQSLIVREKERQWKMWDPYTLQERRTMDLIERTELSKHGEMTQSRGELGPEWIGFSLDGCTLAAVQSFESKTRGKPDPSVLLVYTDQNEGSVEQVVKVTPTLQPPQSSDLEMLWRVLQDEQQNADERFAAAIALAKVTPNDERWQGIVPFIFERVMRAESLETIEQWRTIFQPVKQWMKLLKEIHTDRTRSEHEAAAYLLGELSPNNLKNP